MLLKLDPFSDNIIHLIVIAILLVAFFAFVIGPFVMFIVVEILEWVFSLEFGLSYWKLFALEIAMCLLFFSSTGVKRWKRP
ncbi:MAG TPA: hypothetical protein P5539_16115 [Mesotoga sp.]|nr:hypothetical protein [Mesotoga sp.]